MITNHTWSKDQVGNFLFPVVGCFDFKPVKIAMIQTLHLTHSILTFIASILLNLRCSANNKKQDKEK